MNIFTTAQLLAMMIYELATGGNFNLPKMALYTNDIAPAPGRPLADYTITDFAGLTNLKNVVFGTPFINDSLQAEARGALLTWTTVSLPDPAVTVYGWVEVDTAGTDVLRAERFAVPYQFTRIGQSFSLVPRLVFGN